MLGVVVCYLSICIKLTKILSKLNSISMMNYSVANLLFNSFTYYHANYYITKSKTPFIIDTNSNLFNLNTSIYQFQKYYF